jgi:hypothetical protein
MEILSYCFLIDTLHELKAGLIEAPLLISPQERLIPDIHVINNVFHDLRFEKPCPC